MREVLFRGRSLRYGTWVSGSYIQITEPDGSAYHSIFHPRDGVTEGDEPVDPETVGQWTGLVDCKGVRIFEGDIVTGFFDYEKITGVVVYGSDASFFIDRKGTLGIGMNNVEDWAEVVGNVYDDPELLEGEG